MIPLIPEGHEFTILACFICGFILGLCGGLKIARALTQGLRHRIEQLERIMVLRNECTMAQSIPNDIK